MPDRMSGTLEGQTRRWSKLRLKRKEEFPSISWRGGGVKLSPEISDLHHRCGTRAHEEGQCETRKHAEGSSSNQILKFCLEKSCCFIATAVQPPALCDDDFCPSGQGTSNWGFTQASCYWHSSMSSAVYESAGSSRIKFYLCFPF